MGGNRNPAESDAQPERAIYAVPDPSEVEGGTEADPERIAEVEASQARLYSDFDAYARRELEGLRGEEPGLHERRMAVQGRLDEIVHLTGNADFMQLVEKRRAELERRDNRRQLKFDFEEPNRYDD